MAAATRCASSIARGLRTSLGHRNFSGTCLLSSGHNRWSKIKHDKLKEDAVRSKERSQWARNIQDAVKRSGGDINSNAELSTLVAQAKKAGLPKDIIERAIAKGKGVSLSGDALETVTVEAMLPPSISTIIECQTDNKNRTLGEIRLLVKNAGGTVTPTTHLFEKRGRIVFRSNADLVEESVMDDVLEAGANDMEIEPDQRSLVVYTEPSETSAVAQRLTARLGMPLLGHEIIWAPRPETCVGLDGESPENQVDFDEAIGGIMEDSSVHAVYHNATRT